MAEYIDIDTPLELKVVWGNTFKPYTSTLRELLDTNHIPYTAADVRPVVRGKWKDAMQSCNDSPHVKCSVCGEYYWRYFKKFNFCPNCGTDMRNADD